MSQTAQLTCCRQVEIGTSLDGCALRTYFERGTAPSDEKLAGLADYIYACSQPEFCGPQQPHPIIHAELRGDMWLVVVIQWSGSFRKIRYAEMDEWHDPHSRFIVK